MALVGCPDRRIGLGNKVLQVMWIGTKYAVRSDVDVMAGYYHYIQDSYLGTPRWRSCSLLR